MIRRDGLRKDLTKLDEAPAASPAVAYKDENCARQECGTNNSNSVVNPEPGPGWGMRILKQHEKIGGGAVLSQRRVQSRGSFVNLIGDKTVLTLRDEGDKLELSMHSRTSSGGRGEKLVAPGPGPAPAQEGQLLTSRTTAAATVDDKLFRSKSLRAPELAHAPRIEELGLPARAASRADDKLSLKSVGSLGSTATTTSSSSEQKTSGFRSSSSRHASSSSVGSSGESSIESYFDEEEDGLDEGARLSTSSNSVRRVAYKRGLSQRRIRGSSENHHHHHHQRQQQQQQEVLSPEQQKETVGADSPGVPSSTTSVVVETEQQQVADSTSSDSVKLDDIFTAVKTNDEAKVKALHSAGVSLEATDKNRMTPLIVACLDGNLLLMARTLIGLGANVRGYRSGMHAGYPLHHAAKRGHEHIVALLLSSGAEALAVNDDGQTALDMARVRGHASVVRVIEDWIALFKGILRLITDNAGSQIMKRIWAVVLPSEADCGRHELVLYTSRKVPMPEFVILLGSVTSDFEEPDYTSSDPSLIITDRVTKTKFKFFSHEHGDKAQVSNFYKACKGIPQERNRVPKPAATGELESLQSKKSYDRVVNAERDTQRSGNAPAVPRSRSEKPSSRRNVIYPEESLINQKTSR